MSVYRTNSNENNQMIISGKDELVCSLMRLISRLNKQIPHEVRIH
jgi:hypothetical protein